MSDWPIPGTWDRTEGGFWSTATSLDGLNTASFSTTAWPAANLAIFVPMRLARRVTVYKLVTGSGTTANGNYDVGIYDRFGKRIVSSGATAKTSGTENVVDIADTLLGPGLYYLAMAADDTDNYVLSTPAGTSPVPLQKARMYGTLEMASAYTLPDPATFAARTTGLIPAIGAYMRPY